MIRDFFEIKNCGSDVFREFLAGITSFLSAMYIVALNPLILAAAGLPPAAVLTATVLIAALGSIGMGLYSNNPFLIAPGMGLNTLFVAAVVSSGDISWQSALGCVFYAGLLLLIILAVDRKKRLLSAVPHSLRFGFAGGIGLFIALLGLKSAEFIVYNPQTGTSLGPLNAHFWTFLIVMVIALVMALRKVSGGLILGVLAACILAWPLGRWWGEMEPVVNYTGWLAWPDVSLFGRMDLMGAAQPACWPFILMLTFSILFDSLGTFVGVSEAGDLVDTQGNPHNLELSLKANAVGAALSGLLGSSPATAYIESATGVQVGGRTGLTAVIAGLLFLPLLFFSPLLTLVPSLATAPLLILAGVYMLKPLIYVRWERFDEAVPFFMAMFIMPVTQSITQGIIWGVLSWTLLKVAGGKFNRITPVMLFLNAVALWLLLNADKYGH
ncbi:NCS2 family permease [Candidatus Contubernalis alkaliaceticus]|uniref:NCS2 family permease n=1 Tax=Candidatus Contubernalis alkaliaceticus TaxID=338645 RepID=UPI001F4BEF24|nr:NCS2 family permease [Candidatus Contubernalis alkalaceticus]UNC91065.1 NCS2 family permease [Candidatus Contubernalis alkalaceticus]